jgi:hypothetical protein
MLISYLPVSFIKSTELFSHSETQFYSDACVETSLALRKIVRASSGKMRTDSSPAAMRAAPVAFVIRPSCKPICDAATMNESDVA